MRSRKLLGWLTACLLAMGLLGAPAAAAQDEIGLSRDQTTWTASLDGPLLDPGLRWVPGDAAEESFYVRNLGPSAGRLTVDVHSTGGRLLAPDALDLAARVDGRPWVQLTNGTPSAELTDQALAEDAQARVRLRVRFLDAAPNDTMNRTTRVGFRIYLRGDAGPADPDPSPDPDPQPGPLPDTGSGVWLWMLWVAAALIGSGLALVAGARRTKRAGPLDPRDRGPRLQEEPR